MQLLSYDLRLPGTIDRLSTRYPDVDWAVHPLGPRWIVQCAGPPGSLGNLSAEVGSDVGTADATTTASFLYSPRRAERDFLHDASVWGASPVPPLIWKDGHLSVRLVSPGGGPPAAWRARHPDARLLVKRRIEPRELLALLDRPTAWPPALTRRQSEVLLGAVAGGYYELPRRCHVGGIARKLGIARSTAEEHLRAAESALILSMAPLVEARHRAADLSARPSDADALEHYARFSAELDLYVQMALRDDRIAQVTLSRGRPAGRGARDHPFLRRILRHIATGTDDLRDLPVDLNVGPFERRVLEEVRRIPPGTTRTYGEIAQRVGEPRASRAVGNAVARNPAIVVVPCHRVVPASGGVGQYSGTGGPETKRRLLERERAPVAAPARAGGRDR
jgi:O-6-methylguanine DNA methyltransferase